MKTSLIIPAYFADQSFIEMTQQCLDSLKYGRPNQVVLVNDGSPTGSAADFAGYGVYNAHLPANGGYTRAVNAGLLEAAGDVLIIGNNDLTFAPGWLEGILKPLEQGFDVASIVTSDQGYETRDEITEGNRFGCCWAMKRKVYETLGPLDESLGTGIFSDTDYYLRMKQADFRIAKNWGVLVEHKGAATFKRVDPDGLMFEASAAKFKAKHGFII